MREREPHRRPRFPSPAPAGEGGARASAREGEGPAPYCYCPIASGWSFRNPATLSWVTSTAGTSLEAITQAVARINEMSDHIARAAEQQSEVANVVSQNISTVAQLAKTTEDASQHVFLGTKGLNQLAVALRERISRFKV